MGDTILLKNLSYNSIRTSK